MNIVPKDNEVTDIEIKSNESHNKINKNNKKFEKLEKDNIKFKNNVKQALEQVKLQQCKQRQRKKAITLPINNLIENVNTNLTNLSNISEVLYDEQVDLMDEIDENNVIINKSQNNFIVPNVKDLIQQTQRKKDATDRLKLSIRCQQLLLLYYYLTIDVNELTLYLNTFIIPSNIQTIFLKAILSEYKELKKWIENDLMSKWKLLHPPFVQSHLINYNQSIQMTEEKIMEFDQFFNKCKEEIQTIEKEAAAIIIQRKYQYYLQKIGFYTKTFKISYHHRGLIPGIMDSIPIKYKKKIINNTK